METVYMVLEQEKCELFEFDGGVRVNGIIDIYYDELRIQIIKNIQFINFETDDKRIDYVLKYIKENKKSEIVSPIYKPQKPNRFNSVPNNKPKDKPKADLKNYRITFGKYKGTQIQHVPFSYLKWLIESTETPPKQIMEYCEKTYNLR